MLPASMVFYVGLGPVESCLCPEVYVREGGNAACFNGVLREGENVINVDNSVFGVCIKLINVSKMACFP